MSGVGGNDRDELLFPKLFGPGFADMPPAWQKFHAVDGRRCFHGVADVVRGTGFVSRVVATVLRLPPAGRVPVKICVETRGAKEYWLRRFGNSAFSTCLSLAPVNERQNGALRLQEAFGPICFQVLLEVAGAGTARRVNWQLVGWSLCGVPLPRGLVPKSRTAEFVDEQGRYGFDIDLEMRGFGRLIGYRGWLDVSEGAGQIRRQ